MAVWSFETNVTLVSKCIKWLSTIVHNYDSDAFHFVAVFLYYCYYSYPLCFFHSLFVEEIELSVGETYLGYLFMVSSVSFTSGSHS